MPRRGGFVAVAAVSAQDVDISDRHIIVILGSWASSSPRWVRVSASGGPRWGAIVFTAGAGVLLGFVPALAKTVIARLFQGNFDWPSVTCLAGLVTASLFGTFLVQNAHTRGTPELVVAGLTAIDPLVAVTIGSQPSKISRPPRSPSQRGRVGAAATILFPATLAARCADTMARPLALVTHLGAAYSSPLTTDSLIERRVLLSNTMK